MLDPSYLMRAADPVIDIYSEVESDIASDIARRIVKEGRFTETAKWQLEKAKEFGYFQDDVAEILARASGLSKKEIRKLMKEAGIKSLAYDDGIYRKAGLTPSAIAESPALQALLLQGMDDAIKLLGNLTGTTAVTSTAAFNNILDRAYMQILTGAYAPNTAIVNAIKDIAKNNIEKIAYPTGITTSLENAVRRAVTTALNQTTAKLSLARAEEMGCKLVEVSSHGGARPEHAAWQGQVYSLKGNYKKYRDFYKATGYGTGEGLCGWNCYHSFYPFFEGISSRTFSSDPSADAGRDNDQDYKDQTKQRYYERQVRKAKKECTVYNSAIESCTDEALIAELTKEFERSSVKLKKRESKLQEFVNSTGRPRERDREWVSGWNRSVSSKAVWASKRGD